MPIVDFIKPEKLLASSKNVLNADHLFGDVALHNVLCPKDYCLVKGKGFLVLDFGKEYFGGIRISFGNNTPTLKNPYLRIRFGESYMEASSELGEKGSTNDHSTRDLTVFMSGHSDMTFGSTGFRFVRLDFLEEAEYQIEYIRLAFVHEEEPELEFHSSDKKLDAIIEAAKRTLWLNKQDGVFFEGAKRDQHIWAGDLYPELTAAIYSFSSLENIKNSIRFLLEGYPAPTWYNGIPSYNAWLVLTLLRYFELTGDIDSSYLDCIGENLRMFSDLIDHSFLLEDVHPWGLKFFDWSTVDTEESAFGIRYLFAYALQEIVASPYVREEDKGLASLLLDKVGTLKPCDTKSKAVNAVALMTGRFDKEELTARMKEGGCLGYTAFLSYFILESLSRNGELPFAYRTMLDYFGGMLEIGGTTLFEEFSLLDIEGACRLDECPKDGQKDFHGDTGEECYKGYRKSLCHGWSTGVIPFVLERIVGLKIHAGNRVTLEPNLLDLAYIDCFIPTRHGKMHINIKQENGRYVIETELPEYYVYEGVKHE